MDAEQAARLVELMEDIRISFMVIATVASVWVGIQLGKLFVDN